MDLAYAQGITQEEFVERRQRVLTQLPLNSAALVFSAQETIRNGDVAYPFRQDSYFWYLTGFNEPNSILLLLKRPTEVEQILFLRSKDPVMETWNGYRLGVKQAPQSLGVDYAYSIDDVLAQLPVCLKGVKTLYTLFTVQTWGEGLIEEVENNSPTTWYRQDLRPLVDEMRLIKSKAEIALIQQAGQISALAHVRAMKQCRPNRYEYELESEILHEFTRFGSRFPSYPAIVAGGSRACILHYVENDALLKAGELVLIDAGCEFALYAGDISRTFPVNGKFSEPQKAIYSIVLQAQKRAIELLVAGSSLKQVNQEVIKIKLAGLVELGILQGEVEDLLASRAYRSFYMHGLGHWLGLDVHDVGDYGVQQDRILQVGMVLTVEPGLYIPNAPHIPEIYRGIGVRIEDNIVITEQGNNILTSAVPKEINDIEAIMAKGTNG